LGGHKTLKNPADQLKFQKKLAIFWILIQAILFGRSGPVMLLSFFVKKNATNFRFLIVIKHINCKIKIFLSQAFKKSNDLDEL